MYDKVVYLVNMSIVWGGIVLERYFLLIKLVSLKNRDYKKFLEVKHTLKK